MLGGVAALGLAGRADAQGNPLPSWNAGPAKDAIVKFVHATTDAASRDFVPVAERIAVFDQDGTLWVEHPVYTQIVFAFSRVPEVVKERPELAKEEPFRTVLTGDRRAIAQLGLDALMSRRSRWWAAPAASATQYAADGRPVLTKEPKLIINDDNAGKPEGIHLVIGRRPQFAFGNSAGDREMLEYATAGAGARLGMIVLHDDAEREYAYGPAQGLPDTKIGTFPQSLYDQAAKDGWIVVSMKADWKRVFAFE